MTRLAQLSRQERGAAWIEAPDYLANSDASWRSDELDSDTLRNIAIVVMNQNLSPSRVRTGGAPSLTACDAFSRLSHLVTGLVEQGWACALAQRLENKSEYYSLNFNAFNAPLRVHHWSSNHEVIWDEFVAEKNLALLYLPNKETIARTRWLEIAETSSTELTFAQIEEIVDLLSIELHSGNFSQISEKLEIADVEKMSLDAIVAVTRMLSTESDNIRGWRKFLNRIAVDINRRGEDGDILAGLL